MSAFSENIIFFDTEFTHLDAKIGELLSIGLQKFNGEELYLELEYSVEPHEWVVKNVLPTLAGETVSKEEAVVQLREFLGPDKPFLVAYVNQFDAIFWYDLFGSPMDHPAFWIPIDFASILFAHGYDPNSMGHEVFFEKLGIDKSKYNHHNALDDARLLADTYKALLHKA